MSVRTLRSWAVVACCGVPAAVAGPDGTDGDVLLATRCRVDVPGTIRGAVVTPTFHHPVVVRHGLLSWVGDVPARGTAWSAWLALDGREPALVSWDGDGCEPSPVVLDRAKAWVEGRLHDPDPSLGDRPTVVVGCSGYTVATPRGEFAVATRAESPGACTLAAVREGWSMGERVLLRPADPAAELPSLSLTPASIRAVGFDVVRTPAGLEVLDGRTPPFWREGTVIVSVGDTLLADHDDPVAVLAAAAEGEAPLRLWVVDPREPRERPITLPRADVFRPLPREAGGAL